MNRLQRSVCLVSLAELLVLCGIVYVICVHCNCYSQSTVKYYLSLGIEFCLTLQIWFIETHPDVCLFWNWPAVLSLMTIAIGTNVMNTKAISLGNIIGNAVGISAGIILMLTLPFMGGTSCCLALVVDVLAFMTWGGLASIVDRCSIPTAFAFVAEFLVYLATTYVALRFFL